MSNKTALVVGVSGCSSSGKTTLCRLLRDIFPNTFILHEDDFYKPEEQLPSRDGLLDWDCSESLDVPGMASALAHIRQHGAIPSTLDSKEDQNSVGPCPVPASTVASLKSHVAATLPSTHPLVAGSVRLCLLDGFLLYPPSMAAIKPSLDLRIFLRASYAKAKTRREKRDGYVTLEGFWADPPGYVDKIVWPNYVAEHGWMFRDGDVEAEFREDALRTENIRAQTEAPVDADMQTTLNWMTDIILQELDKHT